MKDAAELEVLTRLGQQLDEVLNTVYHLVGDKGMPDADVKGYFDPFFRTVTPLRYYIKSRINNLVDTDY